MKTFTNKLKTTIVIITLITLFGTGLVLLFGEPDDRVALDVIDFIGVKVVSVVLLSISYAGFKDMKLI